jgi:hypothetical protein
MRIAADTSSDADAVQFAACRRRGGTGRVQVMYDDEQVVHALGRLLHGEDIARRLWPGSEIVEP